MEEVFTNPKNGATVRSCFSFEEALIMCGNASSDFAKDLSRKFSNNEALPSPAQLFWIHKIAVDQANPKPQFQGIELGKKIFQMFEIADYHGLKQPCVRLRLENAPVRIKKAKETSKYPDNFFVTSNGATYYGRITPSGTFLPTRECPKAVIGLLQELAEDPLETARRYAQQYGYCIFCGKELTDDRSRKAGYGPDCAEHFGLPWGEEA